MRAARSAPPGKCLVCQMATPGLYPCKKKKETVNGDVCLHWPTSRSTQVWREKNSLVHFYFVLADPKATLSPCTAGFCFGQQFHSCQTSSWSWISMDIEGRHHASFTSTTAWNLLADSQLCWNGDAPCKRRLNSVKTAKLIGNVNLGIAMHNLP